MSLLCWVQPFFLSIHFIFVSYRNSRNSQILFVHQQSSKFHCKSWNLPRRSPLKRNKFQVSIIFQFHCSFDDFQLLLTFTSRYFDSLRLRVDTEPAILLPISTECHVVLGRENWLIDVLEMEERKEGKFVIVKSKSNRVDKMFCVYFEASWLAFYCIFMFEFMWILFLFL